MDKYKQTKERLSRLHGELDDHGAIVALTDEIDTYRDKLEHMHFVNSQLMDENNTLKRTMINLICNFYAPKTGV